MAKPTNAIRGFIRLTQVDTQPLLINIQNIATVRPSGSGALINLNNNFSSRGAQEMSFRESYEEVIKLITEAS